MLLHNMMRDETKGFQQQEKENATRDETAQKAEKQQEAGWTDMKPTEDQLEKLKQQQQKEKRDAKIQKMSEDKPLPKSHSETKAVPKAATKKKDGYEQVNTVKRDSGSSASSARSEDLPS